MMWQMGQQQQQQTRKPPFFFQQQPVEIPSQRRHNFFQHPRPQKQIIPPQQLWDLYVSMCGGEKTISSDAGRAREVAIGSDEHGGSGNNNNREEFREVPVFSKNSADEQSIQRIPTVSQVAAQHQQSLDVDAESLAKFDRTEEKEEGELDELEEEKDREDDEKLEKEEQKEGDKEKGGDKDDDEEKKEDEEEMEGKKDEEELEGSEDELKGKEDGEEQEGKEDEEELEENENEEELEAKEDDEELDGKEVEEELVGSEDELKEKEDEKKLEKAEEQEIVEKEEKGAEEEVVVLEEEIIVVEDDDDQVIEEAHSCLGNAARMAEVHEIEDGDENEIIEQIFGVPSEEVKQQQNNNLSLTGHEWGQQQQSREELEIIANDEITAVPTATIMGKRSLEKEVQFVDFVVHPKCEGVKMRRLDEPKKEPETEAMMITQNEEKHSANCRGQKVPKLELVKIETTMAVEQPGSSDLNRGDQQQQIGGQQQQPMPSPETDRQNQLPMILVRERWWAKENRVVEEAPSNNNQKRLLRERYRVNYREY